MKLKSGETVLIPQETKDHLLAHPEIWDVLEEALSKVESNIRDFIIEEVDMGRFIGKSGAIRLTESTMSQIKKLQFAKRVGRENWSRVITGAEAPDCNSVVVIASREDDNNYKLITAYVGWLSEREPTDPGLTVGDLPKSLKFWSSYALVYDPEIMGPIKELTWPEAIFGLHV